MVVVWLRIRQLLQSQAYVGSNAKVSGYAKVSLVSGNAKVFEGNHEITPLQIHGTRNVLCFSGNDIITIGCEQHSIDYWLENYEKIGEANNYTNEQIEEYYYHLIYAHDWLTSRLSKVSEK